LPKTRKKRKKRRAKKKVKQEETPPPIPTQAPLAETKPAGRNLECKCASNEHLELLGSNPKQSGTCKNR
jgi:hypothetical protein